MTATEPATGRDDVASRIEIGAPVPADGTRLWELARASRVLDVQPRYAYALWCRDFAHTSVVARRAGEVVGFVSGFLRPQEPRTLFVWQVCVDATTRGTGVGGRMLDAVFAAVPDADRMETTVTPDNESSIAMFTAFASRHGLAVERTELFGRDVLGADHEPEFLYRMTPGVTTR